MSGVELEAGRELDALIAEKVMGWREVRMREARGYEEWRGLPPDGIDMDPLPWFSDRIDDAWQVVEHLRGRAIFLAVCSGESDWLVEVGEGNIFLADTAPLAICRAALALQAVTAG